MINLINSTLNSDYKSASKIARQKDSTLAAFYTPSNVAQILTNWVLRTPYDTLLDPSYGGCSFLTAAYTSLINLGNANPAKQIFGIDIDSEAQCYLKDLTSQGASLSQFLTEDFFNVDFSNFKGQLFNAVVGNPPYLRYHSIPKELQKRAHSKLNEYGITISGRSSYWAYFLLYSIQFLKPGGRLAMVLPGAFLHTDYSAEVRQLLINSFADVNIFLLQERIFDGTQEESVIICADGAKEANKIVRLGHVSEVKQLAIAVNKPESYTKLLSKQVSDDCLYDLLNTEVATLYNELSTNSNVIKLGDWVDTRIGVVTGNNNYFIFSESKREKTGIPEKYFIPIIKRVSYISGLIAKDVDLQSLRDQDKDCLLLNPPIDLSSAPKELRDYIELGEERNVHKAWKCSSRKPWYVVPHAEAPPSAFITCMAASWMRIVINQSKATCTNNIIKLSWKKERADIDWTRLALGTLSTFSQLSAELVGRSYGGGVLKLEPRELTRLLIPLIPNEETETLAARVDKLLREGNLSLATESVDKVLEKNSRNLFSNKSMDKIRSARNQLFLRRRKHRGDADKII